MEDHPSIFGGLFGEKGIIDVLRTSNATSRSSFLSLFFWCKREKLIQTEDIFGVLDSL